MNQDDNHDQDGCNTSEESGDFIKRIYRNRPGEDRGAVFHEHIAGQGFINQGLLDITEIVPTAPPNYNRLRFYNELKVITRQMIHREAKAMIQRIRRKLELLPQKASDITNYLRKEQLSLIEKLDSHPESEVFIIESTMFYTMGYLNHAVLDQLWLGDPSWSLWSRDILGQGKARREDTNLPAWAEDLRRESERLREEFSARYIHGKISDEDYFTFWKRAHELIASHLNLYVYYTVTRWIRRQIWVLDNDGLTSQKSRSKVEKLTQPRLALYYVYLHISDSQPDFTSHENGKEEAYKEVIKQFGFSSWKAFQNNYNRFVSSATERRSVGNIENIKKAIEMLKNYPRAIEYAQQDLIATINKGS